MRIISFIVFSLSLFSSNLSFSQDSNLRAYLDNKQFYAPETGNYIEIYFQFVGHSLKYKPVEGGLQAELAISIQISNGDSIVINDVYRLQSSLMKDSIIDDFYDLKRYVLAPGRYNMNLELQDLNATKASVKASQPIVIEDLSKTISISDIEIIEYASPGDETSIFYKSGYKIIPRLQTFYPAQLSSIPVYFEFYNMNILEDSVCGLKQTLVNTDTGKELPEFTLYTKHETPVVVPIIRNIDIAKLATGNYAINFTLLSRSMVELTTQTYLFQRSNDIEVEWDLATLVLDPIFQESITDDSVAFYLESFIPISKAVEVKNIISTLKSKDLAAQRKHIQAFWLITSPKNTTEAWLKYKEQVQLVEELYSNNFQEGFETDRGRVYLQYGAPTNIVQKETSSNEYPYEIWQYNKIASFSNKRFIFYNPDLVNNGYRLLHSDMIGELKNPGWPQILVKRNTTNGNIDDPNADVQRHYGTNGNDLFRQY